MNRPDLGAEALQSALESLEEAVDKFDATPKLAGKVELLRDNLQVVTKKAEQVCADWQAEGEPEEAQDSSIVD